MTAAWKVRLIQELAESGELHVHKIKGTQNRMVIIRGQKGRWRQLCEADKDRCLVVEFRGK